MGTVTLRGKAAIVTGSGGPGCGRAIALRMAREGASVVVNDVDPDGGERTRALIEQEGGRTAFFPANVGSEAEVRSLIDFSARTFGGVDIIVNNASAPYRPETPFDHWDQTLQVDLMGAVYMVRHGREAMTRRGGGAIVNIASVSAIGHGRKHGEVPGFDIAKAGVIRLTTTLGRLAAVENIRVNCLAPGWIATPEVQAYVDSLNPDQRAKRGVPDVLITTDQIAGEVIHLAINESLAGRVMVWWNGQPPRLIPVGDQGYERLE